MMNTFVRAFARRLPEVITGLKQYHSCARVNGAGIGLLGPSPTEQSLCRLVQRTIIPLNRVKPKPPILDMPCTSSVGHVDWSVPEKVDREPTKLIVDPREWAHKMAETNMLIIRRRKMNKHKRLKRWRKNKFMIVKRKREKRMKKEVLFRQEIAAKLKEVEKFDAEAYVAEKLEMFRRKLLPARLHGKRMPAFVIEDVLQRKKYKTQCIKEMMERRRKFEEKRGSLDVDLKS